jgi:hypothetical protein
MFEGFPSSSTPRSPVPPDDAASPVASEEDTLPEASTTTPPITLRTLGRSEAPLVYRWWAVASVLTHVALFALSLWLGRDAIVHHAEPVAVVLRRRAPPPPPPQPAKPEALRKGGRGISLAKHVHTEAEPEMELSFAAVNTETNKTPPGRWLGGVGDAPAQGAGWSDGVESGAIIRRSLAHDPQELNSGWECDFPSGATEKRLVVRVRIHVSDSGRPTQVTIVRPGPHAFNVSATECAMRERFRPAVNMSGKPVEGDREVSLLFFNPRFLNKEAAPSPPPPPRPRPPPPLAGPQPDLPVQLDEDAPAEEPSAH